MATNDYFEMPYFHFWDLDQVKLWRDDRVRTETFIRDNSYCAAESTESFDIQMSLTLDEYSSPGLPIDVLKDRNNRQVVVWSKRSEKQKHLESSEKEQLDGHDEGVQEAPEIIAVGQFWLWNFQNYFIFSPVAPKDKTSDSELSLEAEPESGSEVEYNIGVKDRANGLAECQTEAKTNLGANAETDLRDHGVLDSYIYDQSWDSPNKRRRVGMILSGLVGFLDRPSESGRSEPVFITFEKAIDLVSKEVNIYVEAQSVRAIKSELEEKYLQWISGIKEELSMIRRVLLQQEEVWREFASNAWPEYWPNGPEGQMFIPRTNWAAFGPREAWEWSVILKTQTQLSKFRRRIEQLDEDAERVRETILTKLDWKQKHAGLKEAHAAAIISAAVLGFTIVTIIFVPLSFVMSLFALPIDRFQQNQIDSPWSSGTKMYSTNYIGKWAGKYLHSAQYASINL